MAKQITLQIDLDGASGVVRGIRGINGSLVDLRQGAEKDGMQFGRIMDFALGGLAANAIAGLQQRLFDMVGDAYQVGKEVETQLSDLEAITGITGEELRRLGETAVQESIRTGRAAAEQIEAYKLLASNIDIATIGGIAGLEELGRQTVTLSQAAKIDLNTAAIAVAGGLNQWNMSADQAARVTNVLAAGSKFGAAEVGDLAAALGEAGATAAAAGIDIETTVGALELMSQRMLKGSQAGTNLRNVVTILRTSSEQLAKLGIKGVNLESDGLVNTLVKLKPLLEDAAGMARIFGRENLNAAQILIENADAVAVMTERVTDTTVAQEQAAIQTDNLEGSLAKLTELIKSGAITSYAEMKDELKEMVDATIAGVLWLTNHKDEMATAARIAAVLTVAIGGLTIAKNASTIATRVAVIAENLYVAAVARSIKASMALRAIMASNPWILAATAIATLGTAMLLFRRRTDEATVSLEAQREEVRGLTSEIDQLASSQLFERYANLKKQQADVNKQLAETRELIKKNTEAFNNGERPIRERQELKERELELDRQRVEIEKAIGQAVTLGADGLEARRDVLAREVAELEKSGKLTQDLVDKRAELELIESQILGLKKEQNKEDEKKDPPAKRTLEMMELELLLMEEGHQKRLLAIDVHVEQEIERFRERYAELYPQAFAKLAEQLRAERDRLMEAIGSMADNAVPVPVKIEAEIELPEGDLDLGEFLADGMVRLNGAIERVNHNLGVLQQRYMEAASAQERWDIAKKIFELQALQSEAELMQGVMEQFAEAGVGAFEALGEGIGHSLAGVEGAMDDMAIALKLVLADLARSIGQMLLRQAAALALAGLWGRAGRMAAAGTGLIAFGALLEGRIREGQRRDEERRRELERSIDAEGNRNFGQGTRTSESAPVRPGSTVFGMPADGFWDPNTRGRLVAYPTLSSISPEGVLQMGSQRLEQRQLEEAVSSAVVKAIGSIEFQAAGTTMKTVRTNTEKRHAMAAIE